MEDKEEIQCDTAKERGKTTSNGQSRQSKLFIFQLCLKSLLAECNIWHQKHLSKPWVYFFFPNTTTQYIGSLFPLIFCFVYPFPDVLTFPKSQIVLPEVYTAFMPVLICRTAHSKDGKLPSLSLITYFKNNFTSPKNILSTLDQTFKCTFSGESPVTFYLAVLKEKKMTVRMRFVTVHYLWKSSLFIVCYVWLMLLAVPQFAPRDNKVNLDDSTYPRSCNVITCSIGFGNTFFQHLYFLLPEFVWELLSVLLTERPPPLLLIRK